MTYPEVLSNHGDTPLEFHSYISGDILFFVPIQEGVLLAFPKGNIRHNQYVCLNTVPCDVWITDDEGRVSFIFQNIS